MTQHRRTCPTCLTDTVVPVVYGFPVDTTFEAASRGEVVLGGCIIDDVPWEHLGQREMRCTTCGSTHWVGPGEDAGGDDATVDDLASDG